MNYIEEAFDIRRLFNGSNLHTSVKLNSKRHLKALITDVHTTTSPTIRYNISLGFQISYFLIILRDPMVSCLLKHLTRNIRSSVIRRFVYQE